MQNELPVGDPPMFEAGENDRPVPAGDRPMEVMAITKSSGSSAWPQISISISRTLKRYNTFVNDKIYDLLLRAQAAAKANGRDIIEPNDCRSQKDFRNASTNSAPSTSRLNIVGERRGFGRSLPSTSIDPRGSFEAGGRLFAEAEMNLDTDGGRRWSSSCGGRSAAPGRE
jgi:hypothetical protein